MLTIRHSIPSLQRISLTCTLDMCTCTDRDLEMHRTTTFGSSSLEKVIHMYTTI